MTVLIVDSQIHIWAKRTLERPPTPGPDGVIAASDREEFSAEDALAEMDAAGVDAAILIPPIFEKDRNDVPLAAAKNHWPRFGVMGRIPLERKADAIAQVESWKEQPGAIGFRLTFGNEFYRARGIATDWWDDGTADWFWPMVEERQIPIFMYSPGHVDEISDIASRFPGLKLTVDHFGFAKEKDAETDAVIDDVLRLAKHPNVALKVSSAPTHTTESYPFRHMQETIKRVVDAFGAERSFWGSDLTWQKCPYVEVVDLVRKECDFLNEHERELILGKGLLDWIGWDLQAQLSA